MSNTLTEQNDMRRRSSLPSPAQFEHFEDILLKIDRNFQRFLVEKETDDARLGVKPDAAIDPSLRSVRFKAAVRVLRESFRWARDFMTSMLRKNAEGRQRLLEVFGDCEKIARVRAILNELKEALPSTGDKYGALESCDETCVNIEAVLQECGLAARLKEALENQAQKVYCTQPPLARVCTAQRHSLLEQIDAAENRDAAFESMQTLFEVYADGQDILQGENFECAVRDMTKYVSKEWDERNERLVSEGKCSMGMLTHDMVNKWVIESVDVDGDRCITRDEAMCGFKKVVDDID